MLELELKVDERLPTPLVPLHSDESANSGVTLLFFWKKWYNLCKQRVYLTFFGKNGIIYANSGLTLLF